MQSHQPTSRQAPHASTLRLHLCAHHRWLRPTADDLARSPALAVVRHVGGESRCRSIASSQEFD